MRVSASIVTHNTSGEQLDRVVRCLLASSVDKIIIVNNSAPGSLPDYPSSPEIEVVQTENNGFGAGHNIAIRRIIDKSDYHIVVNPDVWWTGDIVARIVEFMDSRGDVALLTPKTYYPDGSLQYTCRMLPTPFDVFIKYFIHGSLVRHRMERYLLAWHNHDMPLDCPYLLGSFMFFRVSCLREAGLFDERFFMYPEDIDISRRLHEKWATLYWPEVEIVHVHAAASRHSMRMFFIHTVNMIRYFNKWGWFFDRRRRKFNRRLMSEIIPLPSGLRPEGKG